MAKQTLTTIKNWFKTGLKPTQQQFWDTWDSFWHKDQVIPASSIENLDVRFDEKADKEAFETHLSDLNAHNIGNLSIPAGPINTLTGSGTRANLFYNTIDQVLYIYDGVAWRPAVEADLVESYTKNEIDVLLNKYILANQQQTANISLKGNINLSNDDGSTNTAILGGSVAFYGNNGGGQINADGYNTSTPGGSIQITPLAVNVITDNGKGLEMNSSFIRMKSGGYENSIVRGLASANISNRLPSKNGTLATLEDLPDVSSYAKLSGGNAFYGTQGIIGSLIVNSGYNSQFGGNVDFYHGFKLYASIGSQTFSTEQLSGDSYVSFPAGGGQVAYRNDISIAANDLAKKDGSNATGMWNAAARDAINWGNAQADFNNYGTGALAWLAGSDDSGVVKRWQQPEIRAFIGIPLQGINLQTITDGGNITTNPISITSSAGDLLTFTGNGSSVVQINAYNTNSDGLRIIQRSNNPLSLWTNAAERLTITGNGNVGIGKNSPTEKLEINGTLSSDYVKTPIASTNIITGGGPSSNLIRGIYADTGNDGYHRLFGAQKVKVFLSIGDGSDLNNNASQWGRMPANFAEYSSSLEWLAGKDASGYVMPVAPEQVRDYINVSSGTYTPIVSNYSSWASGATASMAHFIRIGTEVTVTGSVQVLATGSLAGALSFNLSLPIPTSLGAPVYLSGNGTNGADNRAVQINGDTITDTASFNCSISVSGSANRFYYTFTYTIIESED